MMVYILLYYWTSYLKMTKLGHGHWMLTTERKDKWILNQIKLFVRFAFIDAQLRSMIPFLLQLAGVVSCRDLLNCELGFTHSNFLSCQDLVSLWTFRFSSTLSPKKICKWAWDAPGAWCPCCWCWGCWWCARCRRGCCSQWWPSKLPPIYQDSDALLAGLAISFSFSLWFWYKKLIHILTRPGGARKVVS